MEGTKEQINKLDIVQAYYEIEKLENKKNHLLTLYCLKYDIKSIELKQTIVNGGKKLVDALLKKIIKSDEYLDSIISIDEAIMSWTNYLNKEIELMLKNGDDTPVIIFYKEHKNLKTGKFRTFGQIAKLVYMPEVTVKRKYYEYKNDIK